MSPDALHEEEHSALSEPQSATSLRVAQEDMAKQWGYISGSLTFVLLVFPQLFSGLPSPDYVGMSLLGTGVMYVLGYFVGMIWHAPQKKRHVKKQKLKTTLKVNPSKRDVLEKQTPATSIPVSEIGNEQQEIGSVESLTPLEE